MFRRTEESEWARFSKAFPTRDEKRADDGEEVMAVVERGPVPDPEDAPAPFPVLNTSPRSLPDTNLVTRTSIPGPTPAANDDIESTIGPTTVIDGKYRCEHGVRIEGTAQGEIESARAVYIEESAKVTATVRAASIIVAGEVNGELHCSGRVEIRPSGRVTGTINAVSLVMQEGAFFDGNLKMKQAGAPASTPS